MKVLASFWLAAVLTHGNDSANAFVTPRPRKIIVSLSTAGSTTDYSTIGSISFVSDSIEKTRANNNVDRLSNLSMARNRGLEIPTEGATPTEGGMTLFTKAGPDGSDNGGCPFTHYVRMVLHEKGLPYELRCCTSDTKPSWLVDHYSGSMPALRHRKECYIESNVIAQYLDFFFKDPPLSMDRQSMADARECVEGFFPRVAAYFQHGSDGDERDLELRADLETSLETMEAFLTGEQKTGPFLAGNGETFTLLDCSLGPQLYHLQAGLDAFKSNAIDISTQFPAIQRYMDAVFAKDCFKDASYSKDVIVWGWSNARNEHE